MSSKGGSWTYIVFMLKFARLPAYRIVVSGSVLRCDVTGKILMKCFLSGMPDLKLGLNDKIGLEKESQLKSRPTKRYLSVAPVFPYFLLLLIFSWDTAIVKLFIWSPVTLLLNLIFCRDEIFLFLFFLFIFFNKLYLENTLYSPFVLSSLLIIFFFFLLSTKLIMQW